jgi:hypothetical protein
MRWLPVFGAIMLWLNGACYTRFQDLTKMHIAHHVNRVDFCRFNLAEFLNALPIFVQKGLLALEWCFQHTYEVFEVGTPLPKRDRAHEQANTFSNLVSQKYGWLNLLLLNFGYHNAHHELMKCPWHSLHELDRELFNGSETHYVTLPQLVWNYHRFRMSRLYSGQGKAVDESGQLNLEGFYGGIEVSFLVLPV